MAVEQVTKVLVAVHQDRRDEFLKALQRQGTLHIVSTEDAPAETGMQNAPSRAVIEAIELLAAKVPKAKRAGGRRVMSRAEFEQQAAASGYKEQLDRLNRLNSELAEIESRRKAMEAETHKARPWRNMASAPEELYSLKSATVTLGRFPDSAAYAAAIEALQGKPAAIERVDESDGGVLAMAAVLPESTELVNSVLAGVRFEPVDLHGIRTRPADLLGQLEAETRGANEREAAVRKEMESLAAELPRLKVAADALANEENRRSTANALPRTESVSLIHGWVRNRDMARVERLVSKTGAAALTRVVPDENEEPPVALVNRPIFRPFELVLELFSLPSPREFDPTLMIAPFFGIFFALCLTDAGYGAVVALVAYLLLRKLGMNNKLLGIVLIGGLITIPAGALVGGWFGDVPDRLGIPWLQSFKNAVMWFDPVKDPMKFFYLSIALGYLQMITGITIEIVDNIRVKNYGAGLLGQLPWFLLLNALAARILLAKSLPVWASSALMLAVLGSVAAILVFTQRSRATALSQMLWFGLFLAFFTYIGAKLNWLPPGFLAAKWVFLAVLAGMYVQATWSIVAVRRLKPVPLAFGVAGLAGLVLYFAGVLPAWPACVLGALFFLLAPSGASLLQKLAWGGYALYGATSYIGVVLSYIRLMALGMCTGGVAVAVNVIAWMLIKIPVAGILLALIVLVIGHTYNIAVNVLGAFVHSLRLQYVEFFPRFYTGGGEAFTPFRERNQFVALSEKED